MLAAALGSEKSGENDLPIGSNTANDANLGGKRPDHEPSQFSTGREDHKASRSAAQR